MWRSLDGAATADPTGTTTGAVSYRVVLLNDWVVVLHDALIRNDSIVEVPDREQLARGPAWELGEHCPKNTRSSTPLRSSCIGTVRAEPRPQLKES